MGHRPDTPPRPASHGYNHILRRGEHLFRTGDQVDRVYRVVGGIFKSYFIHEDGDEQVIGFHLPGDLIGCDCLADELAAFSVVALDTSSVQRLSHHEGNGVPGLDQNQQKMMLSWMQEEILRLARLLHMERGGTDPRLARFLLDFSEAQRRRGFSAREFHLPMGRRDLARYIGLAPETVSRIFSRLRARGVLAVANNHVRILDHAALEQVARGHSDNSATPLAG
ncbi:helix-turn-helix domain-containing protein [Gammaproteobacteria bacterium AB-CW1]|uniref:Helix-turn-helix domain-containing protein n=1 Tax=Natronospira elongata TaxID=3110268 RepID=A0AAP6MK77_9GAMM|nr:helix-turn-helix domain-containing protein [Gammaproteobacteria bacterium AB-CW1]